MTRAPVGYPGASFLRCSVIWVALGSSAIAADIALPDPVMTPGAIDHRVTLTTICNGTTKDRRRVPPGRCDAVFRAYGIPDTPTARYSYECDHRVPLAIGGANSADNLWPQPNIEAAVKDACEIEVQRRVCHGMMTLANGQEIFLSNEWPAFCRNLLAR